MISRTHAPIGLESGFDTVNLVGWPGSGKGTTTAFLTGSLQQKGIAVATFSVSDEIRRYAKQNPDFARQAKEYAEKGELVPDDLVVPVIIAGIHSLRQDAVWILDGFPRNGDQVKAYRETMADLGRNDLVLHLDLGGNVEEKKAIVEARMIARAQKAIENGETPRRDDVDPVARRKRLEEAALVEDAIYMLQDSESFITLDARKSIEGVQDDCRGHIGSLLPKRMQSIVA